MNKIIVISLGLAVLLGGPASAQEKVDEKRTQELKQVDPVPPATGKSQAEKAGTQESSTKGPGPAGSADVFVNGALAVPGAAADGQTVPSKFSARNAELDELPIAALSLRHLTEAQRGEIFEQLKGGGSGGLALSPGHAKVGAELPSDVALRDLKPVPEGVIAKFPELRRLSYLAEAPNVLLVTSNNVVVGVLSGR